MTSVDFKTQELSQYVEMDPEMVKEIDRAYGPHQDDDCNEDQVRAIPVIELKSINPI